MVYIKLKEMSQYEFASNTNPFDTLTHWNLGFTIITSALDYVCQMREHASTVARFAVSATVFVSMIAYQGINKTQKAYIHFFVLLWQV